VAILLPHFSRITALTYRIIKTERDFYIDQLLCTLSPLLEEKSLYWSKLYRANIQEKGFFYSMTLLIQ